MNDSMRIALLGAVLSAAPLLMGAAGLEAIPRTDMFSPLATSAVPSDVFAVIAKDSFVQSCAARKGNPAAYARANFSVEHGRLNDGTELFEAYPIGDNACIAGAVFVVARSSGGGAMRTALKTGGMLRVSPDGSAVDYGFSGCCEAARTRFRFDGSTFQTVAHDRVKVDSSGDTDEITAIKPDYVDVHFAPGTSSATLSGKTENGFEDIYRLVAGRGQTLSVSTAPSAGKAVRFEIEGSQPGPPLYSGDAARWSGKLPADGAYLVTVGIVDGSTEGAGPIPYTISFGIK